MRAPDPTPTSELHALALEKAAAVLGRERARRLIDRLLRDLGIEIHTPRDLYVLADAMTKLGGFEGAVGAMLGVVAIMRGARGGRNPADPAEHPP